MPTATHDTEVLAAIEDWIRAFQARDLATMLRAYHDEVVLFDVKPPFQTRGRAGVRKVWEEALPCFPATFEYQRRDLRILREGNLAAAHWIFTLRGWPEGHPAHGMWLRATIVLERLDGRWVSRHEHVSLPIDPATGRGVASPE